MLLGGIVAMVKCVTSFRWIGWLICIVSVILYLVLAKKLFQGYCVAEFFDLWLWKTWRCFSWTWSNCCNQIFYWLCCWDHKFMVTGFGIHGKGREAFHQMRTFSFRFYQLVVSHSGLDVMWALEDREIRWHDVYAIIGNMKLKPNGDVWTDLLFCL